MILHGFAPSSSTWRVRIVLNLKSLKYTHKNYDLFKFENKSEAYKKINPDQKVPSLQLEDGTILTESLPICEYLEELYPQTKLLPQSPLQKFQTRRLCEVINTGIQPLHNRVVLKRVAEIGGDKKKWGYETIAKGLTTFETLLEQSSDKFCIGDTVTLADCFLVP